MSHFLFLKNENYFIYNIKDVFSDEDDGLGNFVSEISRRKKKYLANIKNKRFAQVVLNTRKERIKKIWPNTLSQGDGCIINYEQFRLYTLSLPYLNPYTEKQLNINEFLDSKSSCIITIFRSARNPPKFEKTLEISD